MIAPLPAECLPSNDFLVGAPGPSRSPLRCCLLSLAAVLLAVGAGPAHAQRKVPFKNGIPVAPQGLANRKLPPGPFEYATGEGQDIRVVVVTRALVYPFSLAFLPDGSMLVTERRGQLQHVHPDGKIDPQPVAGTPKAYWTGVSGLPGAIHGYMDVVLHPRFAQNKLVYLSYTKPLGNGRTGLAVGRGRWNGQALTGFEDVFVAKDGTGGPGRVAFDRQGYLYITTSGGNAQDGATYGGKVLRLTDDGSIPKDNPFVGRAGYKPEIYTFGHRSSLGLAVQPVTGDMWQTENGPNGGDEVNILRPGKNYGWPKVSLGRDYTGPWHSGEPTVAGYEPPVVYWVPAIATSGMAFYTGDKLPKWKGDLFVGSLRTGEIPGTGHLERILFNEKLQELRRESLLVDLRQRIRDVRQGPDGLLYVLTDEEQGALLRIEPMTD
ncbi:MAG TPA: PQQ-dependent sugar dehydrogenase [Gammaproteobacteria bacterium]|nr:PQQ-dependent sugar dehydrogenase [Gammaproteobacteria bacterium]